MKTAFAISILLLNVGADLGATEQLVISVSALSPVESHTKDAQDYKDDEFEVSAHAENIADRHRATLALVISEAKGSRTGKVTLQSSVAVASVMRYTVNGSDVFIVGYYDSWNQLDFLIVDFATNFQCGIGGDDFQTGIPSVSFDQSGISIHGYGKFGLTNEMKQFHEKTGIRVEAVIDPAVASHPIQASATSPAPSP